MMKKLLSLILALALATTLFACGQKQVSNTTAETPAANAETATFKVGGIGPTTGGAAVYGLAVKNALQIAIDEINANGGYNGYQVEYRFADDEHDAEKSVNAYNSLKDWGMQLLIGTVTSSPCIAVADKTVADNMFQITPSGSAVDCALNPNVFRMCFSDPNQGIASAQYINDHNLAKKVGIIYDSSDVYSTGIYEKFVQEASGKNFEIVAEEQFTADSKTDFTTQLTKIKAADADLVFLPFYYSEAALVLNQAKQMGYAPTFFGCDGMDGILTLENFDKSLAEGLMLLTPFSADATDDLTVNFVKEYQNKYGEIPNQFAADAYDCAYTLKLAIEKANLTPASSVSDLCNALKTTMTTITQKGLTGDSISWEANGEPNKTPKAVVIQNGVYVLAD
ncbi:MAG: ABC transporter substrate-binding protein [Lachnospiraceae bacterium]|nr:ABC transporter substrate-binding protein [Lachnospiraceae bacterium]